MSVNGGAFTALNPSFALASTISFSATTYNPLATNTLNLGSAADNAATVTVRIRALVDSVNSSNVFQAGGTARIDNVMINGTAVPAPGALALLGVAGLVGSRRRR
jgi:MYXO-CTERM domain-containing protein